VVAIGDTIEVDDEAEDAAGFDGAGEDVPKELVDGGAGGCGAAPDDDVLVEGRRRCGTAVVRRRR
jgi:hypothetical protein